MSLCSLALWRGGAAHQGYLQYTASSEDEGRCETMTYHGAFCCRLGSWSIVASLM